MWSLRPCVLDLCFNTLFGLFSPEIHQRLAGITEQGSQGIATMGIGGLVYQFWDHRGGRSRLTFTNQVSLKSRVAQYCRLRNARLVQYSPLTVFGLFHCHVAAVAEGRFKGSGFKHNKRLLRRLTSPFSR